MNDLNNKNRLPEDLRAFLSSSDGFSLSWTVKLQGSGAGGGAEGEGPGGASNREVVAGRIRVDRVSAITRIPLDVDDLRSIKASSKASAAAAIAAVASVGGGVSTFSVAPAPPAGALDFDGGDPAENRDTYGVAAFSIDSACEVGRVALVYGAPRRSPPPPRGKKSCSGGSTTSVSSCSGAEAGLVNPEVWIQDLSCR